MPKLVPVSEQFHIDLNALNLTEQGSQVAARMADHIRTYERGMEHGGVDASVLLPPLAKSAFVSWFRCTSKATTKKAVQRKTLQTMANVYLDLLRTYWLRE